MIKKGNLLRADRPLDEGSSPFVPWKSNLIPQYMSPLGQPNLPPRATPISAKSVPPLQHSSRPVTEITESLGETDSGANETDKIGSEGRSLIDLDIDQEFNQRWLRWKGFYKTLKRKLCENLADAPIRFRELKDSFYSQILLYSLHMSDDSQRHLRKYGAGIYGQYLDSNKDILSGFSGNSMQGRKKAYQFLQKILFCMCLCEILEVHANVLKLEGSAAAGLCPDKKDFVTKHLQRNWANLFEHDDEPIQDFLSFLTKELSPDIIRNITFNREKIRLELKLKLQSTENNLVIRGSTDRVEALEVILS